MGNISRIENLCEWKRIESIWRMLCSKIPDCRIFQTFDWCWNAWECVIAQEAGSELYVLLWKQEGKDDVVIFPFYIDGKGSLRFIMDEHSDYCDCLYLSGRNHHLAFKDALDFIKADKRVKQIALHKMDANSEALNYIAALAPNAVAGKENTYSWIDVVPSDDFAASQSQLRSKDKANVRAIRRKADKRRLRILHIERNDLFPEADFAHLVNEMKQVNRRAAEFMPETLVSFCRMIYGNGSAEIVELLDKNNTPVALNFVLLMASRKLSWIFLYSDPHSSTELYVKYFYDNQNRSEYIFDFGTGGYDYKLGTFRPCMRALWGILLPLAKRNRIESAYRRLVFATKKLVKVLINRE